MFLRDMPQVLKTYNVKITVNKVETKLTITNFKFGAVNLAPVVFILGFLLFLNIAVCFISL